MENDKRQNPRFECEGIATLQVIGEIYHYPGKIEDLSATGCLIELQYPKRIPVDVRVELTFEVNRLPFRLQARVRSVHSNRLIGFQFAPMIARRREQIDELIEELGARHLTKTG